MNNTKQDHISPYSELEITANKTINNLYALAGIKCALKKMDKGDDEEESILFEINELKELQDEEAIGIVRKFFQNNLYKTGDK
jgi:hypothetical protein